MENVTISIKKDNLVETIKQLEETLFLALCFEGVFNDKSQQSSIIGQFELIRNLRTELEKSKTDE